MTESVATAPVPRDRMTPGTGDGARACDVVCVASWNADLVVRVPRPIARGETLAATGFSVSPGGKGSNAAVAAARQGARVALIARIGDDDFGRMGLALWRDEGIDAAAVEVAAGEHSGVAQIQVFDDGDNAIAVFAGATRGLSRANAQAAKGALEGCRVVMASLEVPLDCTLEAFRIARAAGALTVLNPAPATPLADAALALVDVLTPNAGELAALAGLPDGATIADQAQALLSRGVGAVIATLGEDGCRIHPGAGLPPFTLPAHRSVVADTIGAGDTFTGALAAALARGLSLAEAACLANAAAALSVRGHGAIGGMPSLAQAQALLDGASSSG